MERAAGGWTLPIRAFHWLLAVLAVFSFATGKAGGSWLDWHMRSGYAILALVLFRVAWGFIGEREARFATFLRGPLAAAGYARELFSRSVPRFPGHNPLGGWMVVLLLVLLGAQAGSGLFTNDESSHEGPLASTVSNAAVDRLSQVHEITSWVLLCAVALHVAAVALYRWWLRHDVLVKMVRGPRGRVGIALAVLVAAGTATYALVAWYPLPR